MFMSKIFLHSDFFKLSPQLDIDQLMPERQKKKTLGGPLLVSEIKRNKDHCVVWQYQLHSNQQEKN